MENLPIMRSLFTENQPTNKSNSMTCQAKVFGIVTRTLRVGALSKLFPVLSGRHNIKPTVWELAHASNRQMAKLSLKWRTWPWCHSNRVFFDQAHLKKWKKHFKSWIKPRHCTPVSRNMPPELLVILGQYFVQYPVRPKINSARTVNDDDVDKVHSNTVYVLDHHGHHCVWT